MTDSTPVPGFQGGTNFEHKLTRIVADADTEGEKQNGLLLLLVREVHTVKLILWWVLIIVPVVVVVFGALLLAATHQAAPAPVTFTP